MTDVRPFRALRYDPRQVDLPDVLAPVYDVVAPEDRGLYYDRHPYNALRLELTRRVEDEAETDYGEIAARLLAWREEGVLRRDPEPAFYVLRQRFQVPPGTADPAAEAGAALERVAFFGALRLEDYDRGVVRPHERTLAGPKADRLKILRATRTNLSAVLMLYDDREMALADTLARALRSEEAVHAKDDAGIEHTLAPLRDPAACARLRDFLAARPVVIADGHHRYETGLAYRDARRAAEPGAGPEAPFERILACFANAFAPGSLLLPIHRLVREGPPADAVPWDRLSGWHSREVEVEGADAVPAALRRHLLPLADRHAFAADAGRGRLRIFWRDADGELTVRVVHREVLAGVFGLDDEAVREGAVAFPKSALQTARDVRAGRGTVALYLNPLRPDDVFAVTAAGETLPQKSTYFFPKIPTGLLFRSLEAEEGGA